MVDRSICLKQPAIWGQQILELTIFFIKWTPSNFNFIREILAQFHFSLVLKEFQLFELNFLKSNLTETK